MPKSYYIKERDNGQTGTYFVGCGQMSKAAAKRSERPLAGSNIMHEYRTEADYMAKLAELKRRGCKVS